MTTLLPRRGDVVLVEQGLGVVRFVGDVDFDEGKHIGIELKGNAVDYGTDGSFNGVKYFDATPKRGIFIQLSHIIRTITSEEILEKLAILYDIVTGRTSNSNFVECSKYNEILRENQNLQQSVYQQNIIIQNLTKENEVLEAMKTNSSASEETDGSINNNAHDDQHEHDTEMNGKDEYDSDEDDSKHRREHSGHHDDSDDNDHSEIHTEPEETNGDELAQQQLIIEQLSNIDYKCIQSAEATQAGTSNGKSKTNQDSLIRLDEFGPSSIFQLYGVCDGHGPDGHNVSKFVADHLPSILDNLLSNSLHNLSIPAILKKAFQLIEDELTALQNEDKLTFDINYSGTTATVGFVAGNKLYVANVGDSRTVLGRIPPNVGKKKHVPIAEALSTDHDPKNSTEVTRIKKTKSARIMFDDEDDSARIQIELPELEEDTPFLTITQSLNPSVSGSNTKNKPSAHRRTQSLVKKISASVSRSIGDRMAHQYGGLISEPEITVHELGDHDIFVIFASDGIWQMMDNDDVMRAVGTKLFACKQDAIFEDLQKTTAKLVREANISWQDEYEDYTDDITCVIVRVGKVS
eukprot:CAMPEP_0197048986 /NCGR_PEP_ID=MMETSP1384-20130603/24239_1 /TAXON_ID=29189 /ORGANISM="Ammonia sp." /LENGTH=576 /DNA_ID=CAMNT_0042481205 /DNA_START=12 /DNA_END=1742 /DNA_ORIENTATION=+